MTLRRDLRLLEGAIDAHCHCDPSTGKGEDYVDDIFSLARKGQEAGMRALCAKYAFGSSAGMAYLANKYAGAPGCTILGGLCLNKAAGGWNPEAVRILAQ